MLPNLFLLYSIKSFAENLGTGSQDHNISLIKNQILVNKNSIVLKEMFQELINLLLIISFINFK